MDISDKARAILKENRRFTNGHQYTLPSPSSYPYQWLWDSCFHIISLCQCEPDAAKAELRALLSKQLHDGMLPHIIYWEPGDLHRYEWGVDGTSALTQPPMVAYAAWETYRRTNDLSFLKEIYPAVYRYYEFLLTKRDPRGNHLSGIINPDESGEDNSPRFDAALNVPADISYEDHLNRRIKLIDANRACNFDAGRCMRNHFWVKDVPFNAILVKNLQILAHMASALEKTEDEYVAALHADLIAKAMREKMFEGGVFWSTTGSEFEKLRVETWAHFAPLFAGLYTPEEAGSLIDRYFADPETFRAPHGIRTVSKRESSYRSDGYWRGPVWMAPHWFIYQGLVAYGFDLEAKEIREMSMNLLSSAGFREYFNPETGEGYGAENFTWGALILDMMES